jgi:hypothetical protein
MDFRPVIFRETHEGQHLGVCFVHEGSELRHLWTQLIGDRPPLLAISLGVVCTKTVPMNAATTRRPLPAGMSEHIAHEVHAGVVEEVARKSTLCCDQRCHGPHVKVGTAARCEDCAWVLGTIQRRTSARRAAASRLRLMAAAVR